MRQVASVVKDGKVRYFIADAEEGELSEFATIAVPEHFGAEQAIKLGFNLIAAVGLNGHTRPRSVPQPQQPSRSILENIPAPVPAGMIGAIIERSAWDSRTSAVDYIRAHPGCRAKDIAEHFATTYPAVAASIKRHGEGLVYTNNSQWYPTGARPASRERGKLDWKHVSAETVVDYIRAHPGCARGDIASALLGDDSGRHRQVISNRLAWARGKATIRKEGVPNPSGGTNVVRYWIDE